MTYDVLVIGAGLAGLSCALRLQEAGQRVLVVDKARGVGGRLATRRGDGVSFDHGAQYFTARDARFLAAVDQWTHRGIVSPWPARIMAFDGKAFTVSGSEPRHVGVPGMNAICKHLATTLEVRCDWRVATLSRREAGWLATAVDGQTVDARQVVITAPPAQSAALLETLPDFQQQALSVNMSPCWAVMLQLAQSAEVPFDGCFVNEGPLRWVARNTSKPGRPVAEAWVLHASGEWTAAHVDATPGEVLEMLTEAFARLVPAVAAESAVVHGAAHRWLYSQAEAPLTEGFLWSATASLGVAGDWLNGSRVEGAWLSGLQLAEAMLSA